MNITETLDEVNGAWDKVRAALEGLTDSQARAPSLLPGWTCGHVLTHLARNADGNRNIIEGAIAGEEREQYPGGAEQRNGDIEAGATRDGAALLEDLRISQDELMSAWRRMPPAAWARFGMWLAAGRQPVERGLHSRRRELLVHLVDLNLAVRPGDLPPDFLAAEGGWLREHRTSETWPDVPW